MTTNESQCDSCAFRRVEDQSTLESDAAIENKYKVLRSLSGAPKKPRSVTWYVGVVGENKTETCFINSPLWPTKVKDTHCPDRLDDCLSLETALSIRMASKHVELASEANRIAAEDLATAKLSASNAFEQARWARWAATIATIAAIIATKDQILALIFGNP